MAVRITCINKSNGNHQDPYIAISNLGWINESTGETGKNTREEIYDFLVNQRGQAYVKDYLGNIAYLHGAISTHNNVYVRTYTDGKWTDNLLTLPECK